LAHLAKEAERFMEKSADGKRSSSFDLILRANQKDLGGFIVRRALPSAQKRMVGPFIFLDHMGPVDLVMHEGLAVRPHPHIGLSTLTYLFEGEVLHHDSLDFEQLIQPGAVNWMTAGSGISHSERTPKHLVGKPGRVHGLQTWLALPVEKEETAPSFTHVAAKDLPTHEDRGLQMRVIAGSWNHLQSKVPNQSPTLYLDLELESGHEFAIDPLHFGPGFELALYVATGEISVRSEKLLPGELAVLSRAEIDRGVSVKAEANSRFILFGGQPFAEKRYVWWNFVSSSREKIIAAANEWKLRSFPQVPRETEFIPLPDFDPAHLRP